MHAEDAREALQTAAELVEKAANEDKKGNQSAAGHIRYAAIKSAESAVETAKRLVAGWKETVWQERYSSNPRPAEERAKDALQIIEAEKELEDHTADEVVREMALTQDGIESDKAKTLIQIIETAEKAY